MRLTGRVADGWAAPIPAYLPYEAWPAAQRAIDQAARTGGRDPGAIARIAQVVGTITDAPGPDWRPAGDDPIRANARCASTPSSSGRSARASTRSNASPSRLRRTCANCSRDAQPKCCSRDSRSLETDIADEEGMAWPPSSSYVSVSRRTGPTPCLRRGQRCWRTSEPIARVPGRATRPPAGGRVAGHRRLALARGLCGLARQGSQPAGNRGLLRRDQRADQLRRRAGVLNRTSIATVGAIGVGGRRVDHQLGRRRRLSVLAALGVRRDPLTHHWHVPERDDHPAGCSHGWTAQPGPTWSHSASLNPRWARPDAPGPSHPRPRTGVGAACGPRRHRPHPEAIDEDGFTGGDGYAAPVLAPSRSIVVLSRSARVRLVP